MKGESAHLATIIVPLTPFLSPGKPELKKEHLLLALFISQQIWSLLLLFGGE